MADGRMSLRRICQSVRRPASEPSNSREIFSRTAGFSCNLYETHSACFKGHDTFAQHLLQASGKAVPPCSHSGAPRSYSSIRFSVLGSEPVSRWCERMGLSSLSDILSLARQGILALLGFLALENNRCSSEIRTSVTWRSGETFGRLSIIQKK